MSYRNQVLCSSGLLTSVVSISRTTELALPPCAAVAVFCHTLTPEDRRELATLVRKQCPKTKLLALIIGSMQSEELRNYDALVESLAGPKSLIKTLDQLMLPLENTGHGSPVCAEDH